jgi:flagellar biogenesis protein FliO
VLSHAGKAVAGKGHSAPKAGTTAPVVGGASLTEHFVLAIIVVFGAIFALRWWVMRNGRLAGAASGSGARVGPPIALVGRQTLGKGLSIVVARVGDRDFLLGVTPQAVSLLTEVDAALDPDLDLDTLTPVDSSESQWMALATQRDAKAARPAVPAWMAKLDELRERTVRRA